MIDLQFAIKYVKMQFMFYALVLGCDALLEVAQVLHIKLQYGEYVEIAVKMHMRSTFTV